MLMMAGLTRMMHTTCVRFTSIGAASNKSLLAKLRKKTGYTFANCKKALEVSNNDLAKAEAWLKEQALALGWAKATKLSGRTAIQGLVAMTSDQQTAAMVEVNCETDFVSRNTMFQNLAGLVSNACFTIAKQQTQFEHSIAEVHLDDVEIGKIEVKEGKQLADEAALLISQVGEKVSLRRAICVNVDEALSVAAYTHPTPSAVGSTLMGKYGSILIYQNQHTNDQVDVADISKQLCQHIIGMKPMKIGDIEKDLPRENKDDETCMIHQLFLMEPETTVQEVLMHSGISMIKFTRFECGEDLDGEGEVRPENESKISGVN